MFPHQKYTTPFREYCLRALSSVATSPSTISSYQPLSTTAFALGTRTVTQMDYNYNHRMSQQFRGSSQPQQQRATTKKKDDDPDAFMRLVRRLSSAFNALFLMNRSLIKRSRDVSATLVYHSLPPICKSQTLSTFRWCLNGLPSC